MSPLGREYIDHQQTNKHRFTYISFNGFVFLCACTVCFQTDAHIPASTQPSMLCLLSLVTESYVRGVKGYVCVIRSIPLSPPSLITQIETQIRKQFMFICLCSAARHTAHTSVSFRKTALTHSLLLNPMCLNQTLSLTLCAPQQTFPGLILNYIV